MDFYELYKLENAFYGREAQNNSKNVKNTLWFPYVFEIPIQTQVCVPSDIANAAAGL